MASVTAVPNTMPGPVFTIRLPLSTKSFCTLSGRPGTLVPKPVASWPTKIFGSTSEMPPSGAWVRLSEVSGQSYSLKRVTPSTDRKVLSGPGLLVGMTCGQLATEASMYFWSAAGALTGLATGATPVPEPPLYL